jgi:hypothetical protein
MTHHLLAATSNLTCMLVLCINHSTVWWKEEKVYQATALRRAETIREERS